MIGGMDFPYAPRITMLFTPSFLRFTPTHSRSSQHPTLNPPPSGSTTAFLRLSIESLIETLFQGSRASQKPCSTPVPHPGPQYRAAASHSRSLLSRLTVVGVEGCVSR